MKPTFSVGDLVIVGIDEDGYFAPWNSSIQRGFRPCEVDAVQPSGRANHVAVKVDNETRILGSEYFKKVSIGEWMLLKLEPNDSGSQ